MHTKDDCLKSYKDYLSLRNYSDRTLKVYTKSVSDFLNYCLLHEDDKLDFPEYVRQFLLSHQRRGVGWSSINLYYSAIRILSEKVLKRKWDVTHLPRPRQFKQLPRILSSNEVTRLIQSPRSLKHRTLIAFLYSTGLRISEVTNIKLKDIDSDRMELFVSQGKGGKDRIVIIAPCLMGILRIYYKEYRPKIYLFEGSSGHRRYAASSIQKVVKRARVESKIEKPISPHTLRHCYATHHLEHGTDIVYLKEQLGHKDLMTTAKYIHLCRQRMRQINHPIEELSFDIRERIL